MKRILIVDDSRWMCDAIAAQIGYDSHQVDMAVNAQQALEMLQQMSYDLMITDFNMPTMSGVELIEQVRNKLDLVDLPIVMLSVEDDSDIQKQAKSLGVKHWLQKPLDGKQLHQVVSHIIG